jgi:hypothetical protein
MHVARQWRNKHVSPRAVTSHDNEAVFSVSVATAMSYCSIITARESVFCLVRPEAISRGLTGGASEP